MPEHERRAIFGLMVGNEGKTRYAVYVNYTQAGFDPDKDMLQNHGAYVTTGQAKANLPEWRSVGFQHSGGLIVDWDLKTTLDGLYAAGQQIVSGADHSGAAATGRYAGRKAAEHALTTSEPVIDPTQVNKEKARVYGLRKRTGEIGWKELSAEIARVMQDYCGKYKHESTLKAGIRWFEEIRESEALKIDVRNPHELIRALDCHTLMAVGEIIMHASLARKASSYHLDFYRLDYPELDPEEWNKFVTIKLKGGKVEVGELPFNYWLLPPYAPTYEENYKLHASL
jgi:succinate dehydrogenase/fumarate reductase flavoprotein subunit